MPELPETETIARDLNERVVGARIARVHVIREDVLRGATAATLGALSVGRVISRVWRRAKLIVIDLTSDAMRNVDHDTARTVSHNSVRTVPHNTANDTAINTTHDLAHIVVQPRFTGSLLIDDGTLPAELSEYLTVSFTLHDARTLHYRDVRRLGTVSWMSHDTFTTYSTALGPEPLGEDFSAHALRDTLGDSTRTIKAALMDQTRLAGVGNIYATESLWNAGIDPSRRVRDLRDDEWVELHTALQDILRASIAARGTSFRDYRDASGGRGGYVSALQAYGRDGKPCTRCGRKLIGTHVIDGRSTVFCATCQR